MSPLFVSPGGILLLLLDLHQDGEYVLPLGVPYQIASIERPVDLKKPVKGDPRQAELCEALGNVITGPGFTVQDDQVLHRHPEALTHPVAQPCGFIGYTRFIPNLIELLANSVVTIAVEGKSFILSVGRFEIARRVDEVRFDKGQAVTVRERFLPLLPDACGGTPTGQV